MKIIINWVEEAGRYCPFFETDAEQLLYVSSTRLQKIVEDKIQELQESEDYEI